jgi:hypothetical protein
VLLEQLTNLGLIDRERQVAYKQFHLRIAHFKGPPAAPLSGICRAGNMARPTPSTHELHAGRRQVAIGSPAGSGSSRLRVRGREVQTAHEARYRQGRGHEPSHSVHAEFVSSCPGDGFPTIPGPTRVSTSTARFRTESGPFRRRRPPWAPEHRESRAATAILSGLPRLTGIPARRDPEMPPARTPCMTVAAPSGPSQPFADASRGRPASHVPADNPERHRAHHGPVPA